MKIQLINKIKLQEGWLWMGRTYFPKLFAAIQKDIIGLGETADEAIRNCITALGHA